MSKSSGSLTILLKHLSALRPLFTRIDRAVQTHAEWAATFHDLLEAAGWAARSRDSSAEFQTRRKWESALDEVATLDFDSRSDGTRVRFSAALAALVRIATQTLFAPESRHAPIQIMGPLESAGSSFYAVWFLRANDLAWPSNSAPNSLLPWLLQRELAMPGAGPAHDTARAQRITDRIAASAPTVLFSYARQTADGQQRPSPVVTGLAANGLVLQLRNADEIAPAGPNAGPVELKAFADEAPIPPPPERVLQGGASILAAQAACGFRAFAEKRLFSSALDIVSLGLDPRERGSLVHAVLERFGRRLRRSPRSRACLSTSATPCSPGLLTPPSPRTTPTPHPAGPAPISARSASACSTCSACGSTTRPTSARPSLSSRAKRPSATFRSAAPPQHPRRPRRLRRIADDPSANRKTASISNIVRSDEIGEIIPTTRPALPAPRTGRAYRPTHHAPAAAPPSPRSHTSPPSPSPASAPARTWASTATNPAREFCPSQRS